LGQSFSISQAEDGGFQSKPARFLRGLINRNVTQ